MWIGGNKEFSPLAGACGGDRKRLDDTGDRWFRVRTRRESGFSFRRFTHRPDRPHGVIGISLETSGSFGTIVHRVIDHR